MPPVWSSDFPLRLFETKSGAIAWPARSQMKLNTQSRKACKPRPRRFVRYLLATAGGGTSVEATSTVIMKPFVFLYSNGFVPRR